MLCVFILLLFACQSLDTLAFNEAPHSRVPCFACAFTQSARKDDGSLRNLISKIAFIHSFIDLFTVFWVFKDLETKGGKGKRPMQDKDNLVMPLKRFRHHHHSLPLRTGASSPPFSHFASHFWAATVLLCSSPSCCLRVAKTRENTTLALSIWPNDRCAAQNHEGYRQKWTRDSPKMDAGIAENGLNRGRIL